jgi:post-segregation antitoxin (ccd killing protein)
LPDWAIAFVVGRGLEFTVGIDACGLWFHEAVRLQRLFVNVPLPSATMSFAESLRQSAVAELAIAQEIVLERSDQWGFELSAIGEEVRLFHSPGDRLVPYSAVHELASRLARPSVYRVPPNSMLGVEEGHLVMERFWNDILTGKPSLGRYLVAKPP